MTTLIERRKEFGFGFGFLGAWIGSWLLVGVGDSLRAAGLNGSPPPSSGAFQKVHRPDDRERAWIIGTIIGLALLIIAGLFLFGHSRAGLRTKVAMGIAVIVLAPGIAA